ncbi:hypothetical protein [Streptomyces sp. NPDC053560]|uniref:hypothetical protein n=1 Tax=Streptomyces sp. NPDC053560 TaxID=3365711 RepID=UPI0037CCECBA
MSTADPLALLRATAAVQRLDDDLTVHPGDRQRERTYLVHRAALADRAVPALAEVEDPATSERDAAETAHRLLAYDRAHGTGCGSVPASDARWDADPRGYARQEHAAAVRAEHDQKHVRG